MFKKAVWLPAENNYVRRNALQGNLNIEQFRKAKVKI